MAELHYAPYHLLQGTPNIVVDGAPGPDTVLTLSHWPGAPTPEELRADTSTEIVLNYLRAPDRERYGTATAVTNNHVDHDGLAGIWALLHPEQALEQADLLAAVATAGDFNYVPEEQELAAKVVVALNTLLDPESGPFAAEVANLPPEERTARLHQAVLPIFGELLSDIDAYWEHWFADYTDVLRARHLVGSGAVQVEERPELDLSIIQTPLRLDPLVLYSLSRMPRMLVVLAENTYVFEYRYESWVQFQSRRVQPRIHLGGLATRLNMFERREGRWTFEDLRSMTPRLFLRGPDGEPAPSSIAAETVVAEVTEFLRAHAADRQLQWSPYTDEP
ncbi:MAG TPA: DUF6687 family protein [Dehalococcoidia bacterium]